MYMCLSLSLSLLVVALLLTAISAETSAAEEEWIRFDRGELRHLPTTHFAAETAL